MREAELFVLPEAGVLPGGRFGETSARHPFHACNFRRPNGSVGAGSMDPAAGPAASVDPGSGHPRVTRHGCSLLFRFEARSPETIATTMDCLIGLFSSIG